MAYNALQCEYVAAIHYVVVAKLMPQGVRTDSLFNAGKVFVYPKP